MSLSHHQSNIKTKILFFLFLIRSDTAFQERMSWFGRHLPPSHKKLLDVGCGDGYASILAAHRGWRSFGVSFEDDMLDYARTWSRRLDVHKAEFVYGDIRKLGSILPKGKLYDAAVCMEVLEHIQKDQRLLTSVASYLKKGGKVYISVPNERYRPLIGDKLSDVEDGGHVRWGYSFEKLDEMLSGAGLKAVRRDQTAGWITQMILNIRRLLTARVGSRISLLLILPLRLTLPLDRIVTRLSGYPYLSLHVIAVKK